MSGLSPNNLKRKAKRGPNTPSLINFYTNDPLYPSHESFFYKSLNLYKANLNYSKKKAAKNKTNSSTSGNQNNNNSLIKQSIHNKSTQLKTIKQVIVSNNNHNSHEKISTIKQDSVSIDKVDFSQLEKSYKEQLLEKDKTITQLKAEITLYKTMMKTPKKTKNLKLKSSTETNENIKTNGKMFSERLSSYYTPKEKSIFRTLHSNNQGANPNSLIKQCPLLSPMRQVNGSINKTLIFESFNKKVNANQRNSFNKSEKSIEVNYLRNSSTKATSVSLTKTKSVITTTTANNQTQANKTYETILNQLKQKTESILSSYYQLNQRLLTLHNVK